ncbi:uncharacterized protein ACN2A1_002430 [Glossina fuscipes fuscipes]
MQSPPDSRKTGKMEAKNGERQLWCRLRTNTDIRHITNLNEVSFRGDANQEITFKEAIECSQGNRKKSYVSVRSQGRRNYQQKWILLVKGENERWPFSTYDLHKYSALNLQGIEENEMSPG